MIIVPKVPALQFMRTIAQISIFMALDIDNVQRGSFVVLLFALAQALQNFVVFRH